MSQTAAGCRLWPAERGREKKLPGWTQRDEILLPAALFATAALPASQQPRAPSRRRRGGGAALIGRDPWEKGWSNRPIEQDP
jgi:hypothetical protein